jgi:hypothetical protein
MGHALMDKEMKRTLEDAKYYAVERNSLQRELEGVEVRLALAEARMDREATEAFLRWKNGET